MALNNDEDEIKIKPAITTPDCEKMLNEAVDYWAKRSLERGHIMHINTPDCGEGLSKCVDYTGDYFAKRSLEQAQIMYDTFYKIARLLERQPGIGTKYVNGMRRILLGKLRYQIYYTELEDHIEIAGILHTSRGIGFADTTYKPK